MHFSIICGLCFMCLTVLLFHPVQGHFVCDAGRNPKLDVKLTCCKTASTAKIPEPVNACFEQKEDKFPGCKIHAYLFITASNKCRCVDPSADWLPKRLERLKKRGIICKIL